MDLDRPMLTRSQRYKIINALLWEAKLSNRPYPGDERMYAKELNEFELFCPLFDFMGDADRSIALRQWRSRR